MKNPAALTLAAEEALQLLTAIKLDLKCHALEPEEATIITARVCRRACEDLDTMIGRLRIALDSSGNGSHR